MPKYDLISEEIKWCEAHREGDSDYVRGFIDGLKQALLLMKSKPRKGKLLLDYKAINKIFDREFGEGMVEIKDDETGESEFLIFFFEGYTEEIVSRAKGIVADILLNNRK